MPEPSRTELPQSGGEFLAQELYGTRDRAERFYRDQMLDVLTPQMIEFLAEQGEMIVASVDTEGHPDTSVRFGAPGFVVALDERTVAWPELRGNGVMTTIGNLLKNSAAHLMFLDRHSRIGLHLRGHARIVDSDDMRIEHPAVVQHETDARGGTGRDPDRWVVLHLSTSYIHCRKHFPRTDGPIDWGTDDVRAKGGDYFGAKDTTSPWSD